jgi:beta-phosphoglucomutase
MSKKAVIFDLDGVIVSTDECHYRAWKSMADEEKISFDRQVNQRLRGVSRMDSLDIILEKTDKVYTYEQKEKLADRKNGYYRELLAKLTPSDILPGVMDVLTEFKKRGIQIAIGSSSRNTAYIIEKIGLKNYFGAVADGNSIRHSKPDPEVFLLAASMLHESPADCIVVEDAFAGIEAAKAGGMKAVGVGYAQYSTLADYAAADLAHISINEMLK